MFKQTDIRAVTERFEAVAADILEDMVSEVERKNRLKVKDVEVEVVPAGAPGETPTVNVTLTVDPAR